jgi:5-methylcytosine-specific restriction endonuclease McrA
MLTRRLYRDLGYSSIHAYASEELGFSVNRVNRYLHLEADLQRLPCIRRALRRGALGWTKACEIVKVASPRTERTWLATALKLGRRQLADRVARARAQAAARRRENPAQPALMARPSWGGSTSPSGWSGSSEARSAESRTMHGALQSQALLSAPVEAAQPAPSQEASLVEPSDGLPPKADGPVTVSFRLDPLELARFESQVEALRKRRIVPANASREQILLLALESLLSGETDTSPDSAAACQSQEAPAGLAEFANSAGSTGPAKRADTAKSAKPAQSVETAKPTEPTEPSNRVRRRTRSSVYQIVIYRCDSCRSASVRTSRGSRQLSRAQLQAAECDAVIRRPGERKRATIPPSIRRQVFERARHRCQAPGCKSTRFLEVHHRNPRASGGTNRPDNLIVLCSACHRLWHERGLTPFPMR